jgi:hypothetical protein
MIFLLLISVDRLVPGRGIIWTILWPFYRLFMWLILGQNV